MAKTINSDLIRGNINTIILKALYDGDRYGYDIIKEIEIKSHGQYILKQPTLYSCLKRLENQGFIEAYWGEQTSNGGRRKYYRLTENGKEIFKQSQDEYEYSRTVIDNLISDNQYDLSSLTPLENTEKDEEEITEPQQMSMDVSSIEVQPQSQISSTNEKDEKQINEDQNTDIPTKEVKNEYVQPAPVFTEKVENETQPSNTEHVNIQTVNNNEETAAVENSSTVIEKTMIWEHKDLPKINNSEYINSLLSQNSGSYFGRDEEEDTPETQNLGANAKYSETTDDVDEIEKKLMALKASYSKEIEQSEENLQSQNTNFAPSSTYTAYQPKPVFTPLKSDFPQKSNSSNTDTTENYENGFYKYNVQHSGINTEQKDEPIIYRSLSSLMEETNTKTQTAEPHPKPVSIKEQIKIRNFGKLSESIEELGESVKLRPHYDTKHDYKKQYYYRDSYLRLYHYGIMFLLMLVEIFVIYTVGKQAIGANTVYDTACYIISIIACLLLPIIAVAVYIYHPNSKKRNDYNIKSSIIYRLIVTVQLLLIIYALNIWMGMPITFDGKYFVTLTLPMVFIINFPISALIFNSLRKKNKFALKE